jgi:hypothetical protein
LGGVSIANGGIDGGPEGFCITEDGVEGNVRGGKCKRSWLSLEGRVSEPDGRGGGMWGVGCCCWNGLKRAGQTIDEGGGACCSTGKLLNSRGG